MYHELTTITVQNNVSKNYSQGKLLGKGNYARVSIGFHKKTYKQYAIKAITKDKSMENSRTLVI